jgi:hypothetical protein
MELPFQTVATSIVMTNAAFVTLATTGITSTVPRVANTLGRFLDMHRIALILVTTTLVSLLPITAMSKA